MSRAPRYKLPCGCVSDDTRWITLCEPHKAEWQKLHDRAREEKHEPAS